MLQPVRRLLGGITPLDAVIAVGLLAIGLADALTTNDYAGSTVRLAAAATLQTLPLIIRRTQPLAAVALSLLGVTIEVAGVRAYGGVYGLVGYLLLVHAVSRWATGMQRRAGVAMLVVGAIAHLLSQSDEGPLGLAGNVLVTGILAAAAWGLGHVTRSVEQRESQWEARQAEALEEERGRISRELHDVVGHALAGISLTAGAAQQQDGARDPEMDSALSLIREMSRDAASDVRRLVGLLREDNDLAPDTEPQPTLDTLPALVERSRAAGMDVELRTEGRAVPISGGLHLTAFRVVQEGLTNVLKHSPDATALVRVEWTPGALSVSVENTGGRCARKSADGHGLAGLRERVDLFDGTLVADRVADGFLLSARFPLG
jgi:signal transduction histidine kinase